MPRECAKDGIENLFQPQEPQVSAFPLSTSEMSTLPFPQVTISLEMRDLRPLSLCTLLRSEHHY